MTNKTAKQTASNLRKNQTPQEVKLWEILRNRKVGNLKFLRQHPFEFTYNNKDYFFVFDFYCAELKLIIEIDGEIHASQIEQDNLRDDILKTLGYNVVRISNDQLDSNIDFIVDVINKITSGSSV